ncbi:hypothetical protein CRG98_035191 [Punica granatum]|uniref:Uncharacterized protein n=1 Tax=Punica granatum TaxID=22663 RepID=A0A2I0IK86_PUNGR|nr:hypothetical protein CRG98_035191 [Punica granatum]
MTAQAAELASDKAQSFLSSKADFQQPNRSIPTLLSAPGSVPFGSIPTLLLCTGVCPLRINPDFTSLHRGMSPSGQSRRYFSAPGSVPFGSIPTLLLCTGVSPLRVNPDFTSLHRGQSPSGQSRLYFSAPRSVPFGSIPTTFLHRGQSPSGESRLYFSAPGSVPFGSIPTTFLHRGQSPSGQSRLLFCTPQVHWNRATYADVAENARSSSVGCSGKYRRCMMLASRWRQISRICTNLAGAVDVESAHWMRKGRRSASVGMSCRPPSCLITRLGNMSVLPKWLRRGTPTISGHPVIMGQPGFHRATHKKRASVPDASLIGPGDPIVRVWLLGRNIYASGAGGASIPANLTAASAGTYLITKGEGQPCSPSPSPDVHTVIMLMEGP